VLDVLQKKRSNGRVRKKEARAVQKEIESLRTVEPKGVFLIAHFVAYDAIRGSLFFTDTSNPEINFNASLVAFKRLPRSRST